MAKFRVSCEVEVDAADPHEAAWLAHNRLLDPGYNPGVFDVRDSSGLVIRVDLEEDDDAVTT